MKLVNNNLSPLPFYDDLKYQNHRKVYAFGAVYPLRTYKNFLLPFQAVLASGTTADITTVTLHNFSTGTSADITAAIKEAGLTLTPHDGFSLLSYPATSTLSAISQEGLYYLSISITGLGTIYSDIFSSSNNVDDCLLLEYSNSYELEFNGGIVDFSDGFKFKCWLPTRIGRPEYPFEEEVTERMGFSFVETQVSKKVYKFTFLAPEYLCDALRIVRMCDSKKVTCEGLVYDLTSFSMNPEWEEQGNLAAVECEFETDTVIANLGGYTPTIPGEGGTGGGTGGASNVEWGAENIPQTVALEVNEVSKTLSMSGHDHTEEVVRPKVLVVPSVTPSVNSGLAKSEYGLYISTDPVSGEEPTKIGLDEDELWGILGGSDENIKNKIIDESHIPVINANKITGLEDALKGLSSNFVTLSTDQTITGKKTFANDVIFGGEVSKGVYGKMFVPSTEGPGKYSLYVSTDPVSGEAPTAPSGIDEDELWDILGGSMSSKVIDLSHIPSIPTSKITGLDTVLAPYATQAWVRQQGYLASVSLATISDLNSGWDALLKAAPSYYSKAEIGSLLSSYYTKTEADGRFVGVTNEQTVSGKKTFSSLLTAAGGISSTNGDFSGYVSADVLYVPYSGGNKVYSLYVSTGPVSGEQPSEGTGLDEEAMWTALGGSMSSKVIDIEHIPSIPTSKITGLDNALASYATRTWVQQQGYLTSVSLATISDLHSSWDALLKVAPTKYVTRWPTASEVGALTQTSADGRYAIQANDNNLISHDNEFNFIPAGFSNAVWFNFRAKGGTCNISQYAFGRGSIVAGELADLLAKNFIAEGGGSFIKRMQTDASNFEEGPMWDNAAGTSHLAAIGYWNTQQLVFINPRYNEVTDVWDDAVGKYSLVIGKNFLTYNTYPILRTDNIGSCNAGSATKLQTSRTLWGRPFNGEDNVSGDIAANYFYLKDSFSNPYLRLSVGGVNAYVQMTSTGISMDYGRESGKIIHLASSGYVGIGTTSPQYKLDVAGEIRATLGITIGGLDDYGWFSSDNRISCGLSVARGCNVGSLLVSNAWADSTKVPTNGIYSKGAVVIDGTLTAGGNVIAYSSSSRLVKDILPAVSYSRRLKSLGRVVEYRYNAQLERDRLVHTGLIYENVRDVMPSMCFMHEGYGALNYLDKDYICTIAGAVQENIDDIAYLKNRVASLEMEVERLRRGLAA